ncbi:MAG TPA: rhomboid family intramembrane serine protease [Salinivirga sp.]|uniref:rhomboid family intramembrane serine protease n=1 Tax=Salinivirga sp. TaxID=1970192 RepID=UPI002B47F1AA|nr:rhomboid family intramembrane serine protease [Salinivirga sp.]HKK59422.1 rhomboid family intramembrane serine protease [Salinivirga sp.]
MKKQALLKALKISLILLGVIWVVYIADLLVPYDFNHSGIVPRSVNGLKGIFLSPFIHANLIHILSNTLPLLVLTFLLFAFYPKQAWFVILLSIVLGGIAVWLVARPAAHVGASGLIYALAAFLVTAGFLARSFTSLIVSVLVVALYGGLVWGVFPSRPWISWEGHLFGAAAGVLLAFLLKKNIQKQGQAK